MTLIIKAAKTADQKLLTSNFSLHRETNINIAALTTTKKSPRVRMTAGNVRTFNKLPNVAFSKPNNNATQR
jgi:hypothetical protein